MAAAIAAADTARWRTSPNPWVGAAIATATGQVFTGATEPPGGAHAEVAAITAATAAGSDLTGSTMACTLEPCSHHGRTGPCVAAIVAAGIERVILGVEDPDPQVSGTGIHTLRAAGVTVEVGLDATAINARLAPYLHHRRTGRPLVVLKLASTLDGRIAAPDGSSRWITSPEARADAHRLRADSDAIVVGAGTVRTDDPALTVRDVAGYPPDRQPLRVVLGKAPAGARVHPCAEMTGPLERVLDDLGGRGVLQVLVEGGSAVAGAFHRAGLVDRYVLYLAATLMGGDDGRPLLTGTGAATIDALWRGRITDVRRIGADVRIDLEA
jgi:diaminohydroxyphosphoribosylaminopyrimidine deaminase / 5-amino-6-(5-phosphoribosylamino)uracil reductase